MKKEQLLKYNSRLNFCIFVHTKRAIDNFAGFHQTFSNPIKLPPHPIKEQIL